MFCAPEFGTYLRVAFVSRLMLTLSSLWTIQVQILALIVIQIPTLSVLVPSFAQTFTPLVMEFSGGSC